MMEWDVPSPAPDLAEQSTAAVQCTGLRGQGPTGPPMCDLSHWKHCCYKRCFSWKRTEDEAEDRPAGLQLNGVSCEKAKNHAPLPCCLPHCRMLLANQITATHPKHHALHPWRMEAVIIYEQHTTMLSFTAVLDVILIGIDAFCLIQHLSSRRLKETKSMYQKGWDSLSGLSPCSISSKTSNRTAVPNIL